MRENIGLYRGRRRDGGGWVKGYYFEREERTFIMTDSYPLDEDCDSTPMRIIAVEVIPETVGLCSGVPDRKGVKIYEGDIVEALEIGGKQIAPVVFRRGCFLADGFFGIFRIGIGPYKRQQLKVIGNIYDDPELLKCGAENE